jgi:tetratricopeptide (TPR) repeat protein
MMFKAFRLIPSLPVLAGFALVAFLGCPNLIAQGSAVNEMGNGGRHTIQGRIYVSSGRRSDIVGLKIRLINFGAGDASVIADGTGTFSFKNLNAGNYRVIVEGGDLFENFQESVVIDDPGSSAMGGVLSAKGGPKIMNVQVYLRPKAGRDAPMALGVVNAQLASVPKPAIELYEGALRSIAEKDQQRAVTQLREAIAIHKEFPLAWNDLGVLLQNLSDSKGAIDAFRSAVRYDPQSAAANLNLGCALFNAGSYLEAEKHLMAAILRNNSSYRAHYYMGLTQIKLDRPDIAEQAFRRAIEVGHEQAGMAHYMLGGIYWSVKRYKEAADELEVYLKLMPNAKDSDKTRLSIAELRSKQN